MIICLNIQTSDKNHFTEGIIYASETSKIIDENHVLQQAFLNELDEKFWSSADKLRQQLDAANYKHIVLGLIFLKYISIISPINRKNSSGTLRCGKPTLS
ncbi:hypothetical protein DLJ98_03340 [Haemophilus influenzae]|nr:hypothetical protein DLJ98_03340 [Haemophilus influenzae]